MRNLFNRKKRNTKTVKNSILDVLFWTVMAFVLIIGFVVMKFVWTEVFGQISQQGDLYTDEAKVNFDNVNNNFIPLLDSFYVIVIVGVMIATCIGAYALRTHPAFFLVALLFTIIELIIAAPLSNAYVDQIAASGALQATATSFTVSHYIMMYLPLWVFVFNSIISVVMYGLGRLEE